MKIIHQWNIFDCCLNNPHYPNFRPLICLPGVELMANLEGNNSTQTSKSNIIVLLRRKEALSPPHFVYLF